MFLFHKYEEDGQDKADECCKMVPLQSLVLEQQSDDNSKYREGDHLLYHFQLHYIEWTSILVETYSVGGDLGAVLEECDSPGEEDYQYKRPVGGNLHLLELQVSVPGESHEYV